MDGGEGYLPWMGEGVPTLDGGVPTLDGEGVPTLDGEGVPTLEGGLLTLYRLCSGLYASCIHAGGLSCCICVQMLGIGLQEAVADYLSLVSTH